MSSALLDSTLGFLNKRSDRAFAYRGRIFACLRYADDLLILSRCRCRKCALRLIAGTYRDAVVFEPGDEPSIVGEGVMAPFLDLHILWSWDYLEFLHFPKNFKFALTGYPRYLVKFSLEPHLGFLDRRTAQRHRNEIKGRHKRWLRITTCLVSLTVLILSLIHI